MDTIEKYRRYVITSCTKGVEPVVVDHAHGATITDIVGKTYLDCFAGISVVNAGHCNEQVNAAAKAQIDRPIWPKSWRRYCRIPWRRPSSATAAPKPSRGLCGRSRSSMAGGRRSP